MINILETAKNEDGILTKFLFWKVVCWSCGKIEYVPSTAESLREKLVDAQIDLIVKGWSQCIFVDDKWRWCCGECFKEEKDNG